MLYFYLKEEEMGRELGQRERGKSVIMVGFGLAFALCHWKGR